MKAREAIDRARQLRPAAMQETAALYYEWLTEVEHEVVEHMNRHEDPDRAAAATAASMDPLNIGPERAEYTLKDWQDDVSYTEDDEEEEMLLPERFQMVYVYRLMCEIDLMNGETERYNNDATLYNQAFNEWKAWYRRHNKPRSGRRAGWKLI